LILKLARVTVPIHLHPTAPLAGRVLLPGDPGRALLLAQALLTEPKMFNHNRGLWGYTGAAPDGALLTIQSTGMGGPSAAIVASELADLGAQRLLRVGTCGALIDSLRLGQLVVATAALSADGTSRALGASDRVEPDPELTGALRAETSCTPATVVSTDLFYDSRGDQEERWRAAGAQAVEMETATLFALAARCGIRAASLLIVSDLLVEGRVRIAAEDLREAELRLGQVALSALSRVPSSATEPS
jgi:DeoD family purine-nucleoside phosphorylase